MNLPIRSIGSVRKPSGYRASYPEKVEDWIKRFAEASYVVTDSFHGTVFSLLYHTPFVIYIGNPSRATRIVSLLTQLGLEERVLSKQNTQEEFEKMIVKPIDWNDVDSKLSVLRKKSMTELKYALS